MNDSEELTEADDIDPSLIEEVEPASHYPPLRHNFHWITRAYRFHQFSSQVCVINQANFVVKRAPVERYWFWFVERRLNELAPGAKICRGEAGSFALGFRTKCKLPVLESFGAKRAMEAGDPGVAESGFEAIDADFTLSQCVERFAFTQDDFRHIDGSALAIVPNQPATDTVSLEQQAANEAEQARLFGESRERTGLGDVSGGESGEDVDANGEVVMG
ncbi:uncharacterized protein Bfra_008161 [Botrytis fragariae]|uniref:Uncharacterized protein n=1 Tax=Botrytis fragariae TaxID=1964551 RepID=A0A8H6AT35_9HELO|nr:uncharacterized protein Bfra_008161 [Botrytis fragariae]KAF5872885.1 hypothetical protein Bfra_008161 [Botrytis fragariae]